MGGESICDNSALVLRLGYDGWDSTLPCGDLFGDVQDRMANASALVSPPTPGIRLRNLVPSGALASGFWSLSRKPRGLFSLRCTASVEGSVEIAAAPSLSRPRVPRVIGMGSKLVGCGSAVPKLQISNDDIVKLVETSDEWISVRTGIQNRRVLSGEETLLSLATEASNEALSMAQVSPDDVDLIIMCTSTPENLFGDGARVQREVGCKNAWAFDITAACSGFVVGLVTASRFIKGGGYKNVLVVGADCLSQYVDWTDRGTCILFGDGAGAVLVQACDANEDGLLGFDLQSDGHGERHLNATIKADTEIHSTTNGAALFPPRKPSYSCLQMNGKEVFRFAVKCVPQSIEVALGEAGIPASNIDWLLLHQANQRILDSVSVRLQIPSDKVISNLANYGNTSAASIPLALDEAIRSGAIQAGNIIAMSGFGAGLTWASAIVKWG